MEQENPVISLALRRGIFFPSAEIYNTSMAGFNEYGPAGTLMKQKLLSVWKQFCIREEGYDMIDGVTILPGKVFQASGHLSSFTDPVAICKRCKEPVRADHLVQEATGDSAEGLSDAELTAIISEKKLKCPSCLKGELSPVEMKSLMFEMKVGAGEKSRTAYLRPETAQNIFTDFQRIYMMRRKLPLGVAQVGRSYRNEIAPRNALIRQREFEQMELEIFIDPEDLNAHPRWEKMKDTKLTLVTREGNEVQTTPEKMVKEAIAPNQYVAYWVGKTWKLYSALGIPESKMRVKHLSLKETPFYSKVNFDLEVDTSYGPKEALGIAYRTDYDLSQHQKVSGKKQEVFHKEKRFIPHVVEVSIGIDRMFQMILEHSYRPKSDKTGTEYFRLHPAIAPYTSGVFPLLNKEGQPEKAEEIASTLRRSGIDVFYDSASSIGKCYGRADEIGTPFCITVDHQTFKDSTVTLRERDTGVQKRVKVSNLVDELSKSMKSLF